MAPDQCVSNTASNFRPNSVHEVILRIPHHAVHGNVQNSINEELHVFSGMFAVDRFEWGLSQY